MSQSESKTAKCPTCGDTAILAIHACESSSKTAIERLDIAKRFLTAIRDQTLELDTKSRAQAGLDEIWVIEGSERVLERLANTADDPHEYCQLRLDRAEEEVRRLQSELDEQCRINGMGAQRELKLETENVRLSKLVSSQGIRSMQDLDEIKRLREALEEFRSYVGQEIYDAVTADALAASDASTTSVVNDGK